MIISMISQFSSLMKQHIPKILKYLYENIKAEPAVSNIMFERGYALEEYEEHLGEVLEIEL